MMGLFQTDPVQQRESKPAKAPGPRTHRIPGRAANAVRNLPIKVFAFLHGGQRACSLPFWTSRNPRSEIAAP
jgi:hypothetical protein